VMSAGTYTRDNTNKGSILWSEMRRMKKDFNVPIVCGAQVNRNYMNRSEKVPRKTDISDSSAAEKAADALMILHRPYVVDELEAEGDALIQVEKNRSGKEMGSSSRRILLSWDKAHNEYQLREKPGNGDVGHTEGAYVHYSDD
jgi:replicative DNA helicase